MNKSIENWLRSSSYDIKTADAMFVTKRYVYVIFMCHLAVEKALKAIAVDKTKSIPPKTHDLFFLCKLAGLELPAQHRLIVMHLNETSIPTRYPENIIRLVKDYNKTTAQRYLTQTKALLKWLKVQLN